MKVRDPQPFLDSIDWEKYDTMRAQGKTPSIDLEYSDPSPLRHPSSLALESNGEATSTASIISGKIQRFGDNVDTDMVPPPPPASLLTSRSSPQINVCKWTGNVSREGVRSVTTAPNSTTSAKRDPPSSSQGNVSAPAHRENKPPLSYNPQESSASLPDRMRLSTDAIKPTMDSWGFGLMMIGSTSWRWRE